MMTTFKVVDLMLSMQKIESTFKIEKHWRFVKTRRQPFLYYNCVLLTIPIKQF